MAMYRIIFYTAASAGGGYALLNLISPDESKLVKVKMPLFLYFSLYSNLVFLQVLPEGQEQYRDESFRKRQAIVDVLRGAAEGRDPMYRQSQSEINAHKEKYIGKKTE